MHCHRTRARTGLGNHVRVRPTWTSFYTNTLYGMNLYFEFRQAKMGDISLDALYANKVGSRLGD